MKNIFRIFIFILVFSSTHAFSIQFSLGPEIYYAKRTKKEGITQTGTIYGVRGAYERINRYKFYYAVNGLYSWGLLEGKSHDKHLKSQFTNASIESRFGYTFQMKCYPYFSFTPYVGVGYIWEDNRFVHPSPMTVHFNNDYSYFPAGFLSSISLMEQFTIGVNFQVRYIWHGKQKIGNDPDYSDMWQCYQEHLQYRAELPINYLFCFYGREFAARLTPFFEYRHYGQRANYPFDFIDTQYHFYGATLQLVYDF